MSEPKWTVSQKRAIEAGRTDLLVSAGAGSGKSTVLVERVLSHIIGDHPSSSLDRMLILTFTKASAADLRTKVQKALSKKLAETSENDKKKHIRRQLDMLGYANISTIDSFLSEIVTKYGGELGLPTAAHVFDAAEEKQIMLEVMDDTIEKIYAGETSVTGEEYASLCKCFSNVSDYGGEAFLSLYGTLCSLTDGIDSLLAHAEELENVGDTDFFDTEFGKEIKNRTVEMLAHFVGWYDEAIEYFSRFERSRVNYVTPFCDEIENARLILKEFEKTSPSYSVVRDLIYGISAVRLGSGKKGDVPDDPGRAKLYKDIRTEFTSNTKGKLQKLRNKFYILPSEELSKVCAFAAEKTRRIHTLLAFFDREYKAVKRRRCMLTFSDITRYALELVYKNGEVTDIARRISEQFDEVYIDEYQDVSPIQDRIFRSISPKNSRFMVGDIKQCIYAFRDSDPALFASYRDNFADYTDGTTEPSVIYLSECFRCCQKVMNTVNKVFETVFNTVDSVISYREEDKLHERPDGSDPGETVQILIGDKDEISCPDIVAKEISKLISRGVPEKEIAILMQKSTHFADVEAALDREGIKFRCISGRSLFEEGVILLSVALLKVADDPSDAVSAAAVLCSPLYSLTLDDLASLRAKYKKEKIKIPFAEMLRREAEAEPNGAYARYLRDVSDLSEKALAMPADEFLLYVYDEYDLRSKLMSSSEYSAASVQENLDVLYDIARNYEQTSFKGVYRFLEHLGILADAGYQREGVSGSSSENAVTLMTIHKSKGLEFKYVFIAYAKSAFYNTNKSESGILYNPDLGIGLKGRPEKGFVRFDTPLSAAVTEKNKIKVIDEVQRLLYVAMTRAKIGLYIVGVIKNPFDYISSLRLRSENFDGFDVYNCTSFLDWICSALLCKDPAGDYEIKVYSGAGETDVAESEEVSVDAAESERLAEKIKERISYRYPYESVASVPAKLTVSKLYPEVLDELDTSKKLSFEGEYSLKVPDFTKKDRISGTFTGTATHLFMQFCDFDNVEKSGIESEIERLVKDRYIAKETAKAISRKNLEVFFGGELYAQMKKAQFIEREMRFNVLLPASEFSQNEKHRAELEGEDILVQGVVDCVFKTENGDLILLDYKTDSVRGKTEAEAEEMLRRRHTLQLSYYAKAMKKVLSEKVAKTMIYSFGLGRTVEIM